MEQQQAPRAEAAAALPRRCRVARIEAAGELALGNCKMRLRLEEYVVAAVKRAASSSANSCLPCLLLAARARAAFPAKTPNASQLSSITHSLRAHSSAALLCIAIRILRLCRRLQVLSRPAGCVASLHSSCFRLGLGRRRRAGVCGGSQRMRQERAGEGERASERG